MTMQLRTLGGLELEAASAVPDAGTQPKRLALLAYLLVTRPAGCPRRDLLLALFWPDLPEPRARLALRQALHHLRLVGGVVLPGRGAGGAAAAGAPVIACDACAFESDCALGRAEALARYRGDFLDGVHVAGAAAEFEEWVTDRRRHYRELAVCAAWRMATLAERAGDHAGAVAAAERAVQLAPDDEPGLRRLMLLLDAIGNRATALRRYDRFARRLALELGAVPAPATRRLVEQLCSEGRPAAGH